MIRFRTVFGIIAALAATVTVSLGDNDIPTQKFKNAFMLPGLYVRSDAEKSGQESPVDVQIVFDRKGNKFFAYAKGKNGKAQVQFKDNGDTIQFVEWNLSAKLKANTILFGDGTAWRKWSPPQIWKGNHGNGPEVVVDVRGDEMVLIDSNNSVWGVEFEPGTNYFGVPKKYSHAPGGRHTVWTESINFDNADQWKPPAAKSETVYNIPIHIDITFKGSDSSSDSSSGSSSGSGSGTGSGNEAK